jgi:hypothetical protein
MSDTPLHSIRRGPGEYLTPLATRFETLQTFFAKQCITARDRAQEAQDDAKKEHYETLSDLLDEACLILKLWGNDICVRNKEHEASPLEVLQTLEETKSGLTKKLQIQFDDIEKTALFIVTRASQESDPERYLYVLSGEFLAAVLFELMGSCAHVNDYTDKRIRRICAPVF